MTIKQYGGVFGRNPTFNSVDGNEGTFTTLSSGDGEVYAPGNIVGTVSESSGTPTGAVIESGSNANGEYVRFADGTLICFYDGQSDTEFAAGATTNLNWTYPSAFKSGTYPMVIGQMDCVGTSFAASGQVSAGLRDVDDRANPHTNAQIIYSNNSSSTASYWLRAYAIGRWF